MKFFLCTISLIILLHTATSQSNVNDYGYQSEWAVNFKDNANPNVLDLSEYENLGPIANLAGWFLVRHKPTHTRNLRARSLPMVPDQRVTSAIISNPYVRASEQQRAELLENQVVSISDPLFSSQWHLANSGQFGATPGVDVNIIGAWEKGLTGNGVRIAIVDDGIQLEHPDLAPGYIAASSIDVNDNDAIPSADLTVDFHGTSVAGVAAARNNSDCGVGSAFGAEIASIRLTAKASTDAQRANALSYKYNDNHIFSASFAPVSTEYSVGRRGTLTIASMRDSVINGRGGKGSIYVFAAGNGGRERSNCNYNSFANAIETIAVGAIGFDGVKAVYGELCAAMLVVAPSGNSIVGGGIRTSDIIGAAGYDASSCTSTFSGTSSACPLVSGIVALMLEANPDLTWRDVQHILATTAVMTDSTDSDWKINGAGYHVNHKYGFGRVDATAAVQKALERTFLNTQVIAIKQTIVNQAIPDYPSAGIQSQITVDDTFIVENVVATVYISHNRSGDLEVKLTSPSGTESFLSYAHADLPTILVEGGGVITAGGSVFGPALSFTATAYSAAEMAVPDNTCTAPTNCASLSGKISVVSATATCSIFQQVQAMQACGAVGVIVIGLTTAASAISLPVNGDASLITIPNVQLSSTDGATLIAGLSETSRIAFQRGKVSANDYQGWSFSTVRNWGEKSNGVWTVTVTDGFQDDAGIFASVELNIYGSSGEGSSPSASSAANAPVPPSAPSPSSSTSFTVPTNPPNGPPPFAAGSSTTSRAPVDSLASSISVSFLLMLSMFFILA